MIIENVKTVFFSKVINLVHESCGIDVTAICKTRAVDNSRRVNVPYGLIGCRKKIGVPCRIRRWLSEEAYIWLIPDFPVSDGVVEDNSSARMVTRN